MRKIMNLLAVLIVLSTLFLSLGVQPVQAAGEQGLWFHNNTGATVWVVIQYTPSKSDPVPGERMVQVEPMLQTVGWYKIPAWQTVRVLTRMNKFTPHYYYAMSENGSVWSGNSSQTLWIKYEVMHMSGEQYAEDFKATNFFPVVANMINSVGYSGWVEELSESAPYGNNQTTPEVHATSTDRYALVCLFNDTSHTITYDYRWGSNKWQPLTVDAYSSQLHSWEYSVDELRTKEFDIRFNQNFNDNSNSVEYQLDSNNVAKSSCEGARKYNFRVIDAIRVDLFAQN